MVGATGYTKADRIARRVAFAAVGVVIACASCSAALAFPNGSNSATITWHRVFTPPSVALSQGIRQSYSGTVAGHPVTGTALVPVPTSFTHFILGEWTGTYENKRFHLTISASLPNGLASLFAASKLSLKITGTYGSDQVRATATPISNNSNELGFSGTVGPHHVSGGITGESQRGNTTSVTAHFTVSS